MTPTEYGEVCDGCGKLLICRSCGKIRSTTVAQTAVMREIVAQAMLDRFIDRGRVRLGGPTFPDGSKLSDLPSSYSDDFYMDADAILAALAAQPPAAPVAPVERPASFCSRCGGKEPDCYVCKDWPRPQCSAENDDAPNLQRYVAELSLNGRYVWCIVEAIPRKEWVVEQFGCGPDAQKAAYDKLTEAPAPQDRDQLSQIDFMLADGWPNDSVAQPQGASVRDEMIEHQARFLLDRLQEFDPGDFQAERDFHGHVAPAISRLKSALAMTRPELGSGK